MKKVISFLVVSFLITAISQGQSPQYYNANSGGIGNALPFGSIATTGFKTQWLIGPGEYALPSAAPTGYITRLYIWIASTGSGTYTNLTIRLGETSLTSLPPGSYPGQLDTVYFRAAATLSATLNTWLNITLDKPFNYRRDSSLVIEVSHCGFSGTGFNVWQTTGTTGIIRRNNIQGTTSCVFTYSSQDIRILQNGIDVVPSNCGYVWAPQTSGTTSLLYSVKAVNNLVAWAGGAAATVRVTTNGGVTWVNGNSNPGVITGDVYALDAFDANTAWCTTSPGATFIYRTTNGGVNWTQVFTQAGGFIDDIKFNDANTGFAYGDPVGARWSLWKTTNGGATWDSTGLYLSQAGAEAGWNNAMFVIGNTIWLGTSNTRVYKSTNYGATGSWTFGVTTGQVNSYSLHFDSPLLGLIGGTNGLRTTDGGATWGSIGTVPGTGNLTGMEGFGTNFWYTRGTGIYRSTNSGDNWTQSFTAAAGLFDIDLWASTGCLQGWAVGATGTIVKMNGDTLVGIGNNNNQIPNSYILEQNYPNPFNPVTKISFSLPKARNVKLIVFDILGRELITLVNGYRQAGTHSVDFDGSIFSSGVYFYKLEAGTFTDTKKMILMK